MLILERHKRCPCSKYADYKGIPKPATPEPVPVLWSDSVADPILLRNIGSYSHHSESTPLPPNALSLSRPWLPVQGHEDTVVYKVDYSLQELHLILWGISWR